ncbi:MAG: helix-turn-helix transcriptional regulator [Chitinispirillaceae bacterium]|nr:helix-turn-helix transcriptional regulator [Chitinispirillaceae bacterium]
MQSTSHIGKQTKSRRKQLKITQSDLSEISGVSLRTIKAIEKGEANPTIDILNRILEPLGLILVTTERVKHE